MKSFVHTNYPIRVCSLTTGSSGSWSSVCRSVVTKSRDRKVVTDLLSGSRSGKANQQVAGKRTTEGIVKVTRQELLSEAGLGGVECPFNTRRPLSAGKKLDGTCGSPGVKGGDMLRKDSGATGESPCYQRASVVSRSIRHHAESWSDVAWEVGDVHSVRRTAHSSGGLKSLWCSIGEHHIQKSGGNSLLAVLRDGGQGVCREAKSEGFEEKYRAVINGSHPEDEPVGQRWGKVKSAL